MPIDRTTMSKTNLCLSLISFFVSLFFIELLLIGLNFPVPCYITPLFAIGCILIFPLPKTCVSGIILITSGSSFIHHLSVQTTVIFFIALWLSSQLIEALLLPRTVTFGALIILLSALWTTINCAPSTTHQWPGILITVLLVVLLWDVVRKTIAKDTF